MTLSLPTLDDCKSGVEKWQGMQVPANGLRDMDDFSEFWCSLFPLSKTRWYLMLMPNGVGTFHVKVLRCREVGLASTYL